MSFHHQVVVLPPGRHQEQTFLWKSAMFSARDERGLAGCVSWWRLSLQTNRTRSVTCRCRTSSAVPLLLQIVTPLKFRGARVRVGCVLSCGLIVYMLPKYQRGRARACSPDTRAHTRAHQATRFPPVGEAPTFSRRTDGARGRISAPRTAPRREQKADLKRLMLGSVCFLPPPPKPKTVSSND